MSPPWLGQEKIFKIEVSGALDHPILRLVFASTLLHKRVVILFYPESTKAYETHSAVKRPNAVLCKRMRSATDKSKINSGCMQKHTREKAALFLQRYRVREGRFVK